MTLAALKQCKLGRIVHHSKLLQQSLDDLPSRSAWAYVQVLGCVLWQVERGATLHPASLPPSSVVASFLWMWNRHRSRQLELHLYEAGVGTILVLLRKAKMLYWKKKQTNTFYIKTHWFGANHQNSPCSWTGCCWFERCIPSPSAECLQSSAPASPIRFAHPGGDREELQR